MSETPATRGPSIEHLECSLDLTYNWGYEDTRKDLRDLYKKAQRSQWVPDATLPWDTSVDLDGTKPPAELMPLYGSDIERRMTAAEKKQLDHEITSWILSQFLHGEQGALMAATQLVATVPDMTS